jgi:hypothetical protein
MFRLNDFSDALDEILNFIEATPNNTYFYDQIDINRRVCNQEQGVLLIGIAPRSETRPKRGITFIWDHTLVPF